MFDPPDGRDLQQEKYERWWLGKYLEDGRKIIRVEFVGPTSGFVGIVKLYLSDGKMEYAGDNPYSYRPAKKELIVFDEDPRRDTNEPHED